MQVLLASAPHADTFGYSMPPPGLLRLGGALERADIDTRLEDLAYRLGAGELEDGDGLGASAARLLGQYRAPDWFGLSVMGATLPIALVIMRHMRSVWPRARFVLGGPGVNGTDVRILERFAEVDLVVRGEAEITLPELVRGTGDLGEVDGITLRRNGSVHRTPDRGQIADLATLPPYAWHLLPPIADYKKITGEEDGLVPIDSGRGCVYDCSFCSIGRTWNRRSRALPAERLLAEVRSLRDMPGARRAYLCHDIFGADRRQALAFCDAMIASGTDVPWEVRARADHLDAELLARMAAAGGDRVLFGIESASPAVRRRNQKGMRDDIDLDGAIDDCLAAGVTPILSLILGLPGEDDEALEASLRFCARAALRGGVNLSLHLVNPQPGCALGEEYGDRARPVPDVPPDMALGAGTSSEERALIEEHPDLFTTWALLPYTREKIDELVFLSSEFAELLMRYPRTVAAITLATRRTTLELARAWRADGRTFESFARTTARDRGDHAHLFEQLLAWESGLVRMGARGPARPGATWRSAAVLIESDFDLGRVSSTLLAGSLPPREIARATYAVAAPPVDDSEGASGHLPRVATHRLSRDAATLARAIAQNSSAELTGTLDDPKVRDALQPLVDAGIVTPPARDTRRSSVAAPR